MCVRADRRNYSKLSAEESEREAAAVRAFARALYQNIRGDEQRCDPGSRGRRFFLAHEPERVPASKHCSGRVPAGRS